MQTFNLTLTLDELNLLITGLGELPFKISNPMVQKIHQQVQSQVKPTPEPTETKTE